MLVLAFLIVLATAGAQAQVYRGVDPDGTVIFSDRALPNAERLDLPLPGAEVDPQASAEIEAGPFTGPYELFEIVSPADEHRVRSPNGELPVSLVLAPALMEGHHLVVEVGGTPAQGEDLPNPTQITLRGLSLGSHRLRALVRDDSGVIAMTPTVNVHVLPPLPGTAQP
jgi:hypothetical protein